MRIGVTCWSARSPYPSVLCARILKANPDDRVCLMVIRRSRRRLLRDALDKYGWRGLRVQLAARCGLAARSASTEDAAMRRALEDYAQAHDLREWRTLLARESPRLDTHVFARLEDREIVDLVRTKNIEILINAGGGLFREELIRQVPGGILNPHMGPLPKYRGMNALEWTVFHGDRPRVTVHTIERGIDTGAIVASRPVDVHPGDTIVTLRARAYPVSIEVVLDALDAIRTGRAAAVRQDPKEGRQYYVMHPRLVAVTERRIARLVPESPCAS